MHIMFVDDIPMDKVDHLVRYLKENDAEFTYDIVKSVESAVQYLAKNINQIDLAVLDLGLPMYDNGSGYSSLAGLAIVEEIIAENYKIPVIINSTTGVPEACMQKFVDSGLIIKHGKPIRCDLLLRFIQKDSVNLIESNNFYDREKYVFWVNSQDKDVIANYARILDETVKGFCEASVSVSGQKIILVSEYDSILDYEIRRSGTDGIELFEEDSE